MMMARNETIATAQLNISNTKRSSHAARTLLTMDDGENAALSESV
jgi:hypothetical protein